MSHQVNFYLHPNDVARVEEAIRTRGSLVVLNSRSETASPRVVPSLDSNSQENASLFLFLARPEDVPQVVLENVPSQGYWALDVRRSPAVEFTRSFFDGSVLRRGRVYYVDGFYADDGEWVEKQAAFRSWAKDVLAGTKKVLVRRGKDYFGREAIAWLESSGGRLQA